MDTLKHLFRRAAQRALYFYKNIQLNRKIAHVYRLKRTLYDGNCDQRKLIAHKKKWSVLKRRINPRWFKIYSLVSHNRSENFVPEDIYYLIIEPRMNHPDFLTAYKDKNFYERLYDRSLFPKTLLRNIEGVFYDRDYCPVSSEDIQNNLYAHFSDESPIIIKPAVASGGGLNVQLFRKEKEGYINDQHETLSLDFLKKNYQKNFLIQAWIDQHAYFRQFNTTSLNTVRIVTYRSVRTEDIVILQAVQRMGKKGSIVDNQASGGISCGIDRDGNLNDFAVDKYGQIYEASDVGFVFRQAEGVIKFEEMKRIATEVARRNYYARLLGFDFCVDKDNNVRLIEINNKYLEINFLQMNNGPLFDAYTDEVIEYCLGAPPRR